MSTDSRPSFRIYSKKKLQKVLQRNLTSSFRERFISNETYQNTFEKARNLTNTIIDRTGIEGLINKTKEKLPGLSPSNDNSTVAKGFFDSLFSPQTVNDIYLKTVIICLWTIAMVCVLATIITMFIPLGKNPKKTTGVKMIFSHIFLCEFCYLIYILLSMINVELGFQLNSFWCNIGNYGMYVTVSVMYLAFFLLSIQRVLNYCQLSVSVLANAWIIHLILFLIWTIAISIISLIIYFKELVKKPVTHMTEKLIPTALYSSVNKILSLNQCSIDGQLLTLFKALFLIFFILLIVLIVNSLGSLITYTFFTPSFCQRKKKEKNGKSDNMTLIFIFILFLNLIISFPFYAVSTQNSIRHKIFGGQSFSMALKITFILRLLSIILQCFIFYTLESNSWYVLCKLVYYVSGKKINLLGKDETLRERRDTQQGSQKSVSDESDIDESENGVSTGLPATEEMGDDDVFYADLKTKSSQDKKLKKPKKTESSTSDEDDSADETKTLKTQSLSTKKMSATVRSPGKHEQTVNERSPIRKTTSKGFITTDLSKPLSNGKSSPRRASAAITEQKAKAINNDTEDDSTSSESSSDDSTSSESSSDDSTSSESSSDDTSNIRVHSDGKVASSPTKSQVQPVTRSFSNIQHRPSTVLVNELRSPQRRHRRTNTQGVSQSIQRTSRNHTPSKSATSRKQSPRNTNNHIRKPTQGHRSKVEKQFDEV